MVSIFVVTTDQHLCWPGFRNMSIYRIYSAPAAAAAAHTTINNRKRWRHDTRPFTRIAIYHLPCAVSSSGMLSIFSASIHARSRFINSLLFASLELTRPQNEKKIQIWEKQNVLRLHNIAQFSIIIKYIIRSNVIRRFFVHFFLYASIESAGHN